MKKNHIINIVAIGLACLSFVACSRDTLPEIDNGNGGELPEDAIHKKIRETPYPDEANGLFINPAPLIVPQQMKTGDYLQFSLSKLPGFDGPETILSEKVPWCMFNPHKTLDTGVWYWRFRSVDKDGKNGGWSETYHFEVTSDIPQFVTPPFESFIKNAPKKYPRLYCFLDEEIENARRNVTSHVEYKSLIGRANSAIAANYENEANPYNKISEIKAYTTHLYQAYHLTLNNIYSNKIVEFVRTLQKYPLTDSQLFSSNFGSTDIAIVFIKAYDIAQSELTSAEKQAIEELLLKISRYYYTMYCGYQENHIFDNHFWQHNMRILFQAALMLYTDSKYSNEATEILKYYYELWTARAPDSGFNRDGLWRNGVSYFSVNVKTLYYMPSLFYYITKSDFLKHPWYQNAGKAMAYSWPPNSKSSGFGDGSETGDEPNRLRIAFADFIARETGDPYAGWYATQCRKTLLSDYEFRLYRMVRNNDYSNASLPEGYPKLIWHKDAGEVTVHSDITDIDNDLSLSFRSSTFGSGSHTVADQNSFNLMYKGVDIYRNSGYYIDFSGPHNLMSYRHTRAHNTILVNGIGQPFSMEGYGNVVRAIDGYNISYCLGDASNAYSGISNDPLWVKAFKDAGITQSPINGFGETPLTLYRRHLLVLHPNIVVLYDELEAKEAARWDWLLHSPAQFKINNSTKIIETTNEDKNFISVAQIFSNQNFNLSQTDQFVVAPSNTPNPNYPNQWHLTAAFNPSNKNRILTIIQVLPDNETSQTIVKNGNTYKCGEWNIQAELECSKQAGINITSNLNNVVFSYGSDNPIINNSTYKRQHNNSSLLYDLIDSKMKVVETTDYKPISTRISNE